MMPVGPLMIEHRLIERMIALMERELQNAEKEKRVNARLIETATHFIRAYADRCHHGKEEDILFRELKKKAISEENKKTLDQLVEEHKWGRKTTGMLVEANARYEKVRRRPSLRLSIVSGSWSISIQSISKRRTSISLFQ